MPRVRPIERDRAAVVLRSLYDGIEKQFGLMPNIFKTMAHRPELLLTFWNFYKEVWTGGALDPKAKQLAGLRAAFLNDCHY